ncbi:hypothetical protein G7Y89_g10257 [Cudoniella acicularis]|uniref:Gfd2/YDR514C-like C-terminal domain-containing protein n=1 Tax=Cudoniella acicularis TaxID=354080 RepID=A0A8H4W1T8_9HELO|nr:hypothetical protein G7Y89_g10257 [Cudoniella acicularis]
MLQPPHKSLLESNNYIQLTVLISLNMARTRKVTFRRTSVTKRRLGFVQKTPIVKLMQESLRLTETLSATDSSSVASSSTASSWTTLSNNPSTTSSDDDSIVFVSIDFNVQLTDDKKNKACKWIDIREIGFSTLDTRDISGPSTDFRKIIKTENYHRKSSKETKFLFGESKILQNYRDLVLRKILIENKEGRPRKVVLVFHDFEEDEKMLRALHMDLAHSIYPSVVGVIDMKTLAPPLLQTTRRKLREYDFHLLLEILRIPFNNLTIAGNDAHFVMKAMLMLAVRSVKRMKNVDEKMVARIKAIAQGSIDWELSIPTLDQVRKMGPQYTYPEEEMEERTRQEDTKGAGFLDLPFEFESFLAEKPCAHLTTRNIIAAT